MLLRGANSPKLGTILDGLSTAVVCLDEDLRVVFINAAAEILFGVGARHVLGEPVASGVPHLAPLVSRCQEVIEFGAPMIERELTLKRNGEDPLVVDCTFSPLADSKRRALLLLEFFRLDRHMRISRDEQTLAHQKLNREIVRGLAHEIKNPLGGLRGAAQLLERELPDQGLTEFTRIIIREADRLQRLVDQMLGPSRRPHPTELNIHEVLEHVRQLVEIDRLHDIDIVRDYDPSLPNVFGDREQLIQVFLNILRNAVQALGSTAVRCGTIYIRSRARRQFTIGAMRHRLVAQVDIEDNGPGIEQDMIDKIFYPLVTSRADGTGLGLSIAQYLVQNHGGFIECSSRRGRTVFSVFLPISSEGRDT